MGGMSSYFRVLFVVCGLLFIAGCGEDSFTNVDVEPTDADTTGGEGTTLSDELASDDKDDSDETVVADDSPQPDSVTLDDDTPAVDDGTMPEDDTTVEDDNETPVEDDPVVDDTTVVDDDPATDPDMPEEEVDVESDSDSDVSTPDELMADEDVVDETPDIDEELPEDENPFIFTAVEPESTFGIDVDTASYSIVRRYLTYNMYMPPTDKVRIEELINYHDYDYPVPEAGATHPFSVTVEMGPCPWYDQHDLLMIGLKGHDLLPEERKPSNLVFLIDGSGSMLPAARLPLLKTAMNKLVDNLTEFDRVGIIRFNDQPHVMLNPMLATSSNKSVIKSAINSLTASGSTDGGAAIQMAYDWAAANKSSDGNNRIILATDGAFNMGSAMTATQLKDLIVSNRNAFIFLTVLGFGEPAELNDTNLQTMAENGNGNYFYIDNAKEADRVLNRKVTGILFAIAKDVKVQVEFNPTKVLKYRLVGYDKKVLENGDFNNDTVDSGELGAGHTVTAFYQIEYVSGMSPYMFAPGADDFVEVRLRYKPPESTESTMFSVPVTAADYLTEPSENFAFASAVTEWGLLVRDSYYKFDASYDNAKARAQSALGTDEWGLRAEFVTLVDAAKDYDN